MAKFTGTPRDDSVAATFIPPFNGFVGGTLDELLDDVGDKFNGLAGRDFVFAGPGDDILDGGADGDFLHGGLGDDRLIGGPGNDFMRGDGGDDVYEVDSGQFEIPADRDLTQELPGGGHDTARSTIDWILDANVEDLVLLGTSANGTGNSENNEIEGNSAANILSGLDGNDVLIGEEGDDRIDGGAGNDQLFGGTGNDTMTGGPGDDFYVVDRQSHEDKVFENPDGGTDTVHASASYALLTEVENLTLIGKAAIDGIGNPLDNRMEGNSAANTIGGIGGNDVLSGAAGNDFLLGDTGNDIVHGDGGDDRLTGDEGNDELNGGRGLDILEGGSGEDTFAFDSLLFRLGSPNNNLDRIRDFSPADDTLAFSASAFGGGLSPGETLVEGSTLIANRNPLPTTSDGTFLYDTDSGALYWDINGIDPGGQVQVAQIDRAPGLDPGDFMTSRFAKTAPVQQRNHAAALLEAAHSAAVHLWRYLIAPILGLRGKNTMIKAALIATMLSVATLATAWAVPSAPASNTVDASTSNLVEVGHGGKKGWGGKGHWKKGHWGPGKGWRHGRGWHHRGRYWKHRYHYRPRYWQRWGCVLVGPFWYCP